MFCGVPKKEMKARDKNIGQAKIFYIHVFLNTRTL